MASHTGRHGASRSAWRRTLVLTGAGLAAFALGRAAGPSPVPAQSPAPAQSAAPAQPAAPATDQKPEPAADSADYSNRVVAYIYGTIPITREDLGEYLIQRYGADRIELLVNKRIIDHACQQAGIEVTAAEVQASFDDDCRGLGVSPQVFLEQFLAARHKTEYEWKEDVVRPRLQLTKLCHARVTVEEQEIRDAFEAHYGEKVAARVILFGPNTNQRVMLQVYDDIRKSEQEFDRAARQQENSALAASGGKVHPIGHHCASPEVERAAFNLKPGEVSSIIGTSDGATPPHPSGWIIMKCDSRVAPDATKSYDKERENLLKEVHERKVQEMVKVVFKELHEQAKPQLFIQPPVIKEHEWHKELEQTMKQTDAELNNPLKKK